MQAKKDKQMIIRDSSQKKRVVEKKSLRHKMEKILVKGGHSEDIALLHSCCSILFPECDIQILSRRIEGLEDDPEVTETATT